MRKFSLIASVTLLMGGSLMSTGPSLAADCTKGMLWPYVRAAGDCLTDAEIAAGQRGTYSGPTNMNVDVGAIKPADVPAQTGSPGASGFGNSNGALIDTSVFGAEPAARAAAQCRKGILWPFDREPGDCLTVDEKKAGQTGVYGGAAAAQAGLPTTVPAAANPSAETPQPVPQAASCSKSWLWPFVRESGDCQTTGEKRSGEPGVQGSAAAARQTTATPTTTTTAVPPAAAPSTAALPVAAAPSIASSQPVAQPASCSKSWLWPFVKESGDCLTAAEKQTGETGVRASAPAATQATATTAVPAAAAPSTAAVPIAAAPSIATSQPVAQPASCSKSWLWPFVKESGDCLTSAEKQTGGTGVRASAPAATQTTATTTVAVPTASEPVTRPAAQPTAQTASCSKGLLWPFVKEGGDCLTAAEKQAGETGVRASTPAVTQASATTTVAVPTASVPVTQPSAQPAAQTASCSKGLLWPFVKESGDCASDADRKAGQK